MINANPVLQKLTQDKDTIDQKMITHPNGLQSMIKFRGTHSAKDAMSVSSDLNVYDEVDASDQKVLSDYSSRLQASTNKHPIFGTYEWSFSHPSFPGVGVDKHWVRSDQKHWIIECHKCKKNQFLSFPESIDMTRKCYQCKYCKVKLTDDDRRYGMWKQRFPISDERPYSGYWIPLMICPWVTAREIIESYKTKDREFFYTRILGLPYVGSNSLVQRESIMQNVSDRLNDQSGQIVIGVDTGMTQYGVVGNKQGLFYKYSEKGYDKFEELMKRFPTAIAVFDAQGDLRKPRELAQKYSGRIYFAWYRNDVKTDELVKIKKDTNEMTIQRNRMIDFIIDEYALGDRIQLMGNNDDWEPYWRHWKAIYKETEENALGVPVSKWKRSGGDHWVHSSVYWRAGIEIFGRYEQGGFL